MKELIKRLRIALIRMLRGIPMESEVIVAYAKISTSAGYTGLDKDLVARESLGREIGRMLEKRADLSRLSREATPRANEWKYTMKVWIVTDKAVQEDKRDEV